MIVSFLEPSTRLTTWDNHFEEIQLAYNSSIHGTTKSSPFSVVFGRGARLLADPDFGVKTLPVNEYQAKLQEEISSSSRTLKHRLKMLYNIQ